MLRGTNLIWLMWIGTACQVKSAGIDDSEGGATSGGVATTDTGGVATAGSGGVDPGGCEEDGTGTAGGGGSTAGSDPQCPQEQPPYEKPTDRPELVCGGASRVAVLDPGAFNHIMLTPGGDSLAVGSGQDEEDGLRVVMVAELGAGDDDEAVLDRWSDPDTWVLQASGAGIDAVGNLHVAYYESRPGGRLRLRKQDPAGVLLHDLDLGSHDDGRWSEAPLAVAPDGSSAIRIWDHDAKDTTLSRLDPDGVVLWTRSGADAIYADDINADGALVGAIEQRTGFRVLEADGSVRLEIAWPFTHHGTSAIDPNGNVAIATLNSGTEFRYARFAADGAPLWERTSTLSPSAFPAAIDTNAAGDVAIGGGLNGELPWRAFMMRIDAGGELIDQHTCKNASRNNGKAIALSDSGRVVLSGWAFADDDSEDWGFIAAFE